jgi:hypothetical protein
MLSTAGNHNAGDVKFGKDGYLYITIGDGGCDYVSPFGCQDGNFAARDRHTLTGKILRITRDGGIPATNPWAATGDDCRVTGGTTAGRDCRETFSWGHRNPFRFAFDPNAVGTRFFINEVGGSAYEEINEGMAGQDFGWSCREGMHTRNTTSRSPTSNECTPTPLNMVEPIFEYSHGGFVPGTTAGCPGGGLPTSITGGAFVPNGLWPAAYDNKFLFADYVCGGIFQMGATAPYSTNAADFGSGFGVSSITSLRFGPFLSTQALYYTTYAGGVHRIIYSFPKAVVTANPLGGPTPPVPINFNGSGSSDPSGLPLTNYLWDFGDGNTAVTATAQTSHNYIAVGVYNGNLRVMNSSNQTSDPASFTISIGTPPVAAIVSPTAIQKFKVGQSVTLEGSATNSAGAFLPASALEWTVLLHHDQHTHPFFGPQVGAVCNTTSSCVTITAPQPEDFAAAATSYLEIHLKVTDANSLTSTLQRNFQPNKVTVTFATEPPGQSLQLNGAPYATPLATTSWESYVINAQALPQPQPNGQNYVFSSWADGPTSNPRAITTPAATATYRARFLDDGTHRRRLFTLSPCRLIDTRGTAGVPIGGPALANGSTRTFVLTGKCGIPAGTRAVAANLTVVVPTQAGDLRLFPTGGTATSSNLNFRSGQTRANNAVISLDASGQLSVTCAMAAAGAANILLDVVGYFQ